MIFPDTAISSRIECGLSHDSCQDRWEREWFRSHRKPRDLDQGARELLRTRMRNNPSVPELDDSEIDWLASTACYYEFEKGEIVRRQFARKHMYFFIEKGRVDKASNGFNMGNVWGNSRVGGIPCVPPYSSFQEDRLCPHTNYAMEDYGVWGISMDVFLQAVTASRSRRKAARNGPISNFLDSCGHFHGLSAAQKDQIAQASHIITFEEKEPLLVEGVFCPIARGLVFVMSGEVSVDGCADLTRGNSIRPLGSPFAPDVLQRAPCSMAAKTKGKLLFLRFAELEDTFANDLAQHLEHLERRKPQPVDLKAVCHLGSGAFGSVTLVQHQDDGAKYALKKIRKNHPKISEVVAQECAALHESRHPFVLDLELTFETEDCFCMVTEHLSGGDLFDLMHSVGRRFSNDEARFYVGSILVALEALHSKKIVHRDLKPENVMIDSVGYVRLIDFGLSKTTDDMGRAFTCTGSPAYMAPEMFKRDGYTSSVDLWALGIILHEFLYRSMPFGINREAEAGLPAEVKKIAKAVRKEPLVFPGECTNIIGQDVISILLRKDPDQRPNCNGLRSHEFFQASGPKQFFDMLIHWELEPPVKPSKVQKHAFGNDSHTMTEPMLSHVNSTHHSDTHLPGFIC